MTSTSRLANQASQNIILTSNISHPHHHNEVITHTTHHPTLTIKHHFNVITIQSTWPALPPVHIITNNHTPSQLIRVTTRHHYWLSRHPHPSVVRTSWRSTSVPSLAAALGTLLTPGQVNPSRLPRWVTWLPLYYSLIYFNFFFFLVLYIYQLICLLFFSVITIFLVLFIPVCLSSVIIRFFSLLPLLGV